MGCLCASTLNSVIKLLTKTFEPHVCDWNCLQYLGSLMRVLLLFIDHTYLLIISTGMAGVQVNACDHG